VLNFFFFLKKLAFVYRTSDSDDKHSSESLLSSQKMLTKSKAAVRQLLAQFPRNHSIEDKAWLHLWEETQAHMMVLESQVTTGLMEVFEDAKNGDEARTALKEAVDSGSTDTRIQFYVSCGDILQLLRQLVHVLWVVQSDVQQIPNWPEVDLLHQKLQDIVTLQDSFVPNHNSSDSNGKHSSTSATSMRQRSHTFNVTERAATVAEKQTPLPRSKVLASINEDVSSTSSAQA
jgi:hypothetical protein